MVYQIIIAAGLTLFLLNAILNLKSLKVPRADSKVPDPPPLVSILVPARDEEANIGECLASLCRQDYPNFEILVLDDNSADDTALVVSGIAAEDKRVRLIRGQPLPEGWAGKPFACYQLAKAARGSWLLFVDADTTHAPHMLRSTLDLAIKQKTSLLSGFPRQMANSLPQKVAIPVLYLVILGWVPLWWLHLTRPPWPSVAIGQFLLFPSEDYWRIGGHVAVKAKILEDVWLGIETSRHGGRHIAVDLSPVVSCDMYRNLGGMWEGFIKWCYSIAAKSTLALAGLLVVGLVFYLGPFYWISYGLWIAPSTTLFRGIVIFQVGVILLMRALLDNRFKEPVISALLHPLGFSFLCLAAFYAAGRRVVGAGVSWKKRVYGVEESVLK